MIGLYYLSYSLLPATHKLLNLLMASHLLLRALFSGIWLGVLRREALLEINSAYYSRSKKYKDPGYNKSGFLGWERTMIARYFQNCKRFLVVGAGGGREVMALRRLGYEVDGFECNCELIPVANALLEEEGLNPSVRFAAPDTFAIGEVIYDGLIVGWGAYMLIQGRHNRIALVRKMRSTIGTGAPLFVSFFVRSADARWFFVTKAIGNGFRRLLGRENIELGDALEPEYVHYFTKDEIAAELREGGFVLEYYSDHPYGHAVGIAT